jgi:hypothetical protein
MTIKMILKSTVLILRQIHVCGAEAGMLDGAIKNIESVINTLEKLEKEEAANGNHNE